jgi:hypothetical protein
MTKLLKYIYLVLCLIPFTGFSQTSKLSPQAEVSVITCGPGYDELYATFGHSAFRVLDIPNKIDRVYNYGTFDFDTPNFYTKFAQGKLLYELRAYNFGSFLRSYHDENRWVKGQVLDLKPNAVQLVFDFLENNAKPENRSYKYDFFYDNCSTKLYDVLETVLGDKIAFQNDFDMHNYTHRDLIQLYLANHPWGDFGIDLALGSVIDDKATAKEYMFLPDFVFKAFTKIHIKENGVAKPIVKRTEEILLEQDVVVEKTFFTPVIIFSILALVIIVLTYLDYKKWQRNKIVDFILFMVTGLAGILIFLLWFATDHSATANNFNILWAFFPNVFVAFILLKNKTRIWLKNYVLLLLILLDILVLFWIFKVQIFSIALIPILVGLYVRYIYLWIYFRRKTKEINLISS